MIVFCRIFLAGDTILARLTCPSTVYLFPRPLPFVQRWEDLADVLAALAASGGERSLWAQNLFFEIQFTYSISLSHKISSAHEIIVHKSSLSLSPDD